MERIAIAQRSNWEQKVKEQGFTFYKNYYLENAAYQFAKSEIDNFETATDTIFAMCQDAMEFVLNNPEQLRRFKIPEKFHEIIRKSWKDDHISFYGRFDLAYNGKDIKLLEFNADTPTSLLEASVIQWYWLQDYNSGLDQFNSIHEKLVDHLNVCKEYIEENKLAFASIADNEEDFMTVKYLEDCASQAGVETEYLTIEQISVNEDDEFCRPDGTQIKTIFKLYPYEWMFHEEFADYLISNFDITTWIEPFYKAIWSNKMFMVILSEMFPESSFILKARDKANGMSDFVKKPLMSREGANVTIYKNGEVAEETGGDYGYEGYIYQEYFDIPKHNGKTAIIGSWIIGGEAAGIGIRESDNLITNNTSFFVPHFIKD